MARQEALAIADRRDDLARDVEEGPRRAATLGRRARRRAAGGRAGAAAVDPSRLRDRLHNHAEIGPYTAMQAWPGRDARGRVPTQRGDWAWEVVYSRRQRYGDMVSFQFSFDLPWQREQRQQPVTAAKRHEIERIEAERDDAARRHARSSNRSWPNWRRSTAQHERLAGAGLSLAAERVSLVSWPATRPAAAIWARCWPRAARRWRRACA